MVPRHDWVKQLSLVKRAAVNLIPLLLRVHDSIGIRATCMVMMQCSILVLGMMGGPRKVLYGDLCSSDPTAGRNPDWHLSVNEKRS